MMNIVLSSKVKKVMLHLGAQTCRKITVALAMSVDKMVEDITQLRNFSTSPVTLEKEILIYSNKKQTPVSLKTLMETGRGDTLRNFDEIMKNKLEKLELPPQAAERIRIQVACFLHRELPVRLAHRATRLESSPLFLKSGMFVIM